ncbi:preprotein translocase subunit SecE [Propionibacterium acidifaciens]
MADDSMHAGDAQRAPRRGDGGKAPRRDGVGKGPRRIPRAGRPARRSACAEDSAKGIKRKHTTAPVRRADGAGKRSGRQEAERRRATPWSFAKQSVGELKKVIWPNGQEVGQYFIVVLVFVVLIMAIVAGLDYGFAKLLLKLFG